ncbi:GNAT domain-domain-containing protein [Aspergillus taichungensis]|uniref:GNAT domain-domain-containing protein n=1 Tax=Aspergillus taichungensis TaxID=482145 RepID=A0A2J5IA83_9EURO|nr:GNAT domain-domain-containing protein [Aspergillus taichungensis]
MSPPAEVPFDDFVLLTPRLIIVPTPIAVSLSSYRALYSDLHADVAFCEMAFGHHLPAQRWSDAKTRDVVQQRDIGRCWKPRGMGDFAVGRRMASPPESDPPMQGDSSDLSIIRGQYLVRLAGPDNVNFENIKWIGYAGVRDATTTSMPAREPGDPLLPSWREMVELRYGFSPEVWGTGVGQEAAKSVMQWAVRERGVLRFIAETERENERSAKVLKKLGFIPSGTNYWKEPKDVCKG